jgi:cAMP phosphodiesterase
MPEDASAVEPLEGITARAYPVSHGESTKGDAYDSSAFFIAAGAGQQQILFFGDVGAGAFAIFSSS